MACVVLAILACAGGAYVVQSQQTLAVHRDRSVAMAVAGSRLEEIRATSFTQLTNFLAGYTSGTNIVWIKRSGTFWQWASSADYDPFTIGSYPEELRTGLQFINLVTNSGHYEGLQVTVQATYRIPDYVSLQTIYAP